MANTIEITIHIPELEHLLQAISQGASVSGTVTSAAPPAVIAPTPVQAPPISYAPIVPAVAPAAMPAPVPVAAAPAFTLEQLSKAAADLIQSQPRRMTELQGLLAQYGVAAMTMLPKEQYGAFATALRGMGAHI